MHYHTDTEADGRRCVVPDEVVSCNSKPRQQSPAANETRATVERKPRPHPDKGIKCPRCPSTNTKFCCYNYSMSQPRYFCKECRRYWTQGGSLRNVPTGGACRKNKRSSTSSSSSASLPSPGAAASKITKQIVPEPMVSPSCTDFPNVLPTFSSPDTTSPWPSVHRRPTRRRHWLPLGRFWTYRVEGFWMAIIRATTTMGLPAAM